MVLVSAGLTPTSVVTCRWAGSLLFLTELSLIFGVSSGHRLDQDGLHEDSQAQGPPCLSKPRLFHMEVRLLKERGRWRKREYNQEAEVWRRPRLTSTTVRRPKQVRGHVQGLKEWSPALDEGTERSHCQGWGGQRGRVQNSGHFCKPTTVTVLWGHPATTLMQTKFQYQGVLLPQTDWDPQHSRMSPCPSEKSVGPLVSGPLRFELRPCSIHVC